ncbi:hypothetical protein LINPERHAP2_LOCUS17574 [Linum perenne]
MSLQSLNVRVPGSVSFNNFLTVSPTWSVSDSSSDLDTESTGSFFHDKTITLGSLIGGSNILELSKKSKRGKQTESLKAKKVCKSKPWIFSLCAKDPIASDSQGLKDNVAPPSLGDFLAVERRTTSNGCRRKQGRQSSVEEVPKNSLFVNGHVAPPHRDNANGGSSHGGGVPVLLLSCVCGQSS